MIEQSKYFTLTNVHKNCRNFYKLMYDLEIIIDLGLVESLEVFGNLSISEFSKYSKLSKDVFNIKEEEGLEISGAIGDKSILFVIPKKNKGEKNKFEKNLINYIKTKT